MKLDRPVITSDRYSNLNSNDKMREYQRDVTLYEQAKALEKLANQKQEVNVKVDNSINEEYLEAIQEQNELLRDQMILQNLTGEEKQEYLKTIKEKAEEKQRELELKNEIHNIYEKGRKLSDILERFNLDIREAVADKKLKEVTKASKILDKTKSKSDIFAVWFFILIMGGTGLGVYSSVANSRGIEFNIISVILYILTLVIYPIVAISKSNSNNLKLKNYDNTMNDLNEYTPDVVRFITYTEDIDVMKALESYKDYCVKYINDTELKYKLNKNDFTDLDPYIFTDTLSEIDNI